MFTPLETKRYEAVTAIINLEGFSGFCSMPDNQSRMADYLNFLFEKIDESLTTTGLAGTFTHFKFIGDGAIYIWRPSVNESLRDLGGRVFLALHNLYRTYPADIQDEQEELGVREAPKRLRVGIAQGEVSELSATSGIEFVGYSISLAARLQAYCRQIGFLVSTSVSLPDHLKEEYSLVKGRTKISAGTSLPSEEIRFVREDASDMSRREIERWFTLAPGALDSRKATQSVQRPTGASLVTPQTSNGTLNETISKGELMDPFSIIGAISAGLNIIDKFRSLALRLRGETGPSPSVHAEVKDGAMEIQRVGQPVERIEAASIKTSQWDELRYSTLEKKVRINWDIFNQIDGELPTASLDEKARLRQKLESIKCELCQDFRELLGLYERTLGTPLGDHYALNSLCGPQK